MPAQIIYTQEEKESIIQRYINGETCKEISRIYKGTDVTICNKLNKWGVEMRPSGGRAIVPTDKQWDFITSAYQNGKSVHDIARDVPFCHSTVWKMLVDAGVALRNPAHFHIYDFNHDFFSELTEESLYFMGLIAADGNLHKARKNSYRVSLSSKDTEILEKFRQAVSAEDKPYYDNRDGTHVFVLNSKKMFQDLCKHGITEKKSLTLEIKNKNLTSSRHFWRGVIDGDGQVSFTSGGYPIIFLGSGSKRFIAQFCQFLNSQGIDTDIGVYHTKESFWVYQRVGPTAKKIVSLLYRQSSIFMERKHRAALEIME